MLHQSKPTSALPELNTKQGPDILNRTLPLKSVLVGNDSFPKEKVNFHHGLNYGRNWDWDKPPATSNQHQQRSRRRLVDESLPPRMKPEKGGNVAFVDPQVGDLLTRVEALHAHKLQFNRPKTAAANKMAKAREGNTVDFAADFGLPQPTASEPFTSWDVKVQTPQSQVYIKK